MENTMHKKAYSSTGSDCSQQQHQATTGVFDSCEGVFISNNNATTWVDFAFNDMDSFHI